MEQTNISPKQKALIDFQNLDQAGYAGWIRQQVDAVYPAGGRPQNFSAPIFNNLCQRPDLNIEIMPAVYQQLVPDNKKALFRAATGEVLIAYAREPDDEPFKNDKVVDLIFQASLIGAKKELLASFDGIFAHAPSSQSSYISALIEFSSKPSAELEHAAKKILQNNNFNEAYLFGVLEILIDSNPSNIVDVVSEHLPRLTALREDDGFNERLVELLEKVEGREQEILERLQSQGPVRPTYKWMLDAVVAKVANELEHAAKKILQNNNFNEAYLFGVLEILIDSNPSNVVDVVSEHLPRLTALREDDGFNERLVELLEKVEGREQEILERLQSQGPVRPTYKWMLDAVVAKVAKPREPV